MKNKKLLRVIIICIAIILCPFIIYGSLYASMYIAGFLQIGKNIDYQNAHLEYLQNEFYTDEYTPCNEQKFADFDLKKAFSNGTKINEIAVIGTHNSYQTLTTTPKRVLAKVKEIIFDKENKTAFEMDTFTVQLENGIRNLEIDIETVDKNGEVSFIVTHDPITDNVSSAYNFSKALQEIALWSDNNPGHLPIYLLIEPKGNVVSLNNMQNFSQKYAVEFDKALRDILGEKLLTPKDAMGDFESLEEMREADSWPTLKKAAGKVIVILHPCDVTEEYIKSDMTIKTQAMFPALGFENIDKSYASFILENYPETAVQNNKVTVAEKNLMVRTRADDYPNFSDERYAFAEKCGSHIFTTDYPPRTVRLYEHTYSFDGYTVKLLNK